jgi:sulfhydrogenase subunit gamma (sulfur reductase)
VRNPYLPILATIQQLKSETSDTTTFTLQIDDPAERDAFTYQPGQFMEVSLFGAGEAPFCIASEKHGRDTLDITVRRLGRVTKALHALGAGGQVGLRGPLGNWFPMEEVFGKHVLFVGGGLGLAPLRPQIREVYRQRDQFASVTVLVGARTQGDLVYRDELEQWQGLEGMTCLLTVDVATDGWTGNVGVVGTLLPQWTHLPQEGVVFVCGPPIMIRFVVRDLEAMGFSTRDIYTTLESHMRCGIGKCNHCMIGDKYVCLDGPVFTYEQLQHIPEFLT